MRKKIAVVLAGCGHQDGTEITEAAAALIALAEFSADYQCFAADIDFAVQNHLTQKLSGETRSVLAEAARIARGNVKPLQQLSAKDFHGLVLPGGTGAAKTLFRWAEQGANCAVLPDAQRVIEEFHSASQPIAAICIAPALIARILGRHGVEVTLGNDSEIAREVEKTGAKHVNCPVTDFITDRLNKVITTPAYMYGQATPFEVFTGIRGAIKEFIEMA